MSRPLRIALVDDQDLVRSGFRMILDAQKDMCVVGQASDGVGVLPMVKATQPDIVLMDIRMPTLDGISATHAVLDSHPDLKVLILTTFDLDEYAFAGLRAGASGFLLKDTRPAELAEAIRKIAAGLRVIDPTLAQESVIVGPNPLTDREKDVLRLAARGADARDIADCLHLGAGTVRNYLSSAISKTHARNRTEAARTAETNGWL